MLSLDLEIFVKWWPRSGRELTVASKGISMLTAHGWLTQRDAATQAEWDKTRASNYYLGSALLRFHGYLSFELLSFRTYLCSTKQI